MLFAIVSTLSSAKSLLGKIGHEKWILGGWKLRLAMMDWDISLSFTGEWVTLIFIIYYQVAYPSVQEYRVKAVQNSFWSDLALTNSNMFDSALLLEILSILQSILGSGLKFLRKSYNSGSPEVLMYFRSPVQARNHVLYSFSQLYNNLREA